MIDYLNEHRSVKWTLIIVLIVAGGIAMETNKQHRVKQEMISEVKKNRKAIEEFTKEGDPFHRIKKITIKYDSVELDPMGAIHFYGYVNDDPKLFFQYGLMINSVGGLDGPGLNARISSDLYDFTHEEDNNGE